MTTTVERLTFETTGPGWLGVIGGCSPSCFLRIRLLIPSRHNGMYLDHNNITAFAATKEKTMIKENRIPSSKVSPWGLL